MPNSIPKSVLGDIRRQARSLNVAMSNYTELKKENAELLKQNEALTERNKTQGDTIARLMKENEELQLSNRMLQEKTRTRVNTYSPADVAQLRHNELKELLLALLNKA